MEVEVKIFGGESIREERGDGIEYVTIERALGLLINGRNPELELKFNLGPWWEVTTRPEQELVSYIVW